MVRMCILVQVEQAQGAFLAVHHLSSIRLPGNRTAFCASHEPLTQVGWRLRQVGRCLANRSAVDSIIVEGRSSYSQRIVLMKTAAAATSSSSALMLMQRRGASTHSMNSSTADLTDECEPTENGIEHSITTRRELMQQFNTSAPSRQPSNLSLSDTMHNTLPPNLLDISRGSIARAIDSDERKNPEEERRPSFHMGDPLHEESLMSGSWRNRAGAFINSKTSQLVIMLLIIVNAGILGALTFLFDNEEATRVLENIDLTLLVIFTVETLLQASYLGPKRYFRNKWLLWDFCIITFSWIFLSFPSISILRSFRIFRLLVLFSRFKSMRYLLQAVGRTIPKMTSIWFALLLFFYIFCVLFTNLYHDLFDEYLDYDYFGRLDRTFLTLFQFMTLDSWSDVVRQVLEARPAALLGFCIWIIITSFFVLNLVVAVICESLIELNNMRETKRQHKMLKQQRHLISAQTEELLEETHEVVKLQKELLSNQVVMQQLLLQIANHLAQEGTPPAEGNGDGGVLFKGKGSLSKLMSNFSDSSSNISDEEVTSDELQNGKID